MNDRRAFELFADFAERFFDQHDGEQIGLRFDRQLHYVAFDFVRTPDRFAAQQINRFEPRFVAFVRRKSKSNRLTAQE